MGPTAKSGSRTSAAGKEQKHGAPKKKTPRQPPSDADRLKRLFTSLCAQIDGGHFGNAVKTCDKILRIKPRDTDALQTKVFLLLQTEQYVQALSLIEEVASQGSDASLGLDFEFEKAYSLYRLHREAESTAVLESVKAHGAEGEGSRGVTHLEAQLAYREGEYQAAFDLYNTLLDTAEPHSDEQADVLTNLSAAQSHLDFLNSGYLSALTALPPALADALESAPPPALPSPSHLLHSASNTVTQSRTQIQVQSQSPPQSKKPRARRLPAGVVPGVTPPPDPERWLKKSERSSYMQAHAKRRGKGAGGGATQGIVEASAPTGGGGKGKKKGKK